MFWKFIHKNSFAKINIFEEAAKFILCALLCGKNKDIFVVDKEPEKIISLAENLIKKSGKKLNIEIIGIRSGEKLEEKPYEIDELTTTSTPLLSLLNKKEFSELQIQEVKQSFKLKPLFTLQKELDFL